MDTVINEFEYDDSMSYESNYNKWLYEARRERAQWNDAFLEEDVAHIIFRKMYGFKDLQKRVFG